MPSHNLEAPSYPTVGTLSLIQPSCKERRSHAGSWHLSHWRHLSHPHQTSLGLADKMPSATGNRGRLDVAETNCTASATGARTPKSAHNPAHPSTTNMLTASPESEHATLFSLARAETPHPLEPELGRR